jgi:UDP-N-acetylmuramoyl-tripeptide--D-alanyl-D-alanine ligase
MISAIASLYLPRYVTTIVYMLQSTEYQAGPYLKWYWRTQNFSKVAVRKQLKPTKAAKLLRLTLGAGMIAQILCGLFLIYLWHWHNLAGGLDFGLAIIISYPLVWAQLAIVFLWLGKVLIATPRERSLVLVSAEIFKKHKGVKIAVAGSYGKTSMKELLSTVLSKAKIVAATPANKNVAISHAEFAASLTGKEDIVIIEFGEGRPGDVANFTKTTSPNRAIITGIAPAHLDHYKSVDSAAKDIFSVTQAMSQEHVYVNADSPQAEPYLNGFERYGYAGALGWSVSHIKVAVDSLSFNLSKDDKVIKIKSKLIGRHQIGPLSLAAALGREFGLTSKQVSDAIEDVIPFEHRMQPYQLNGAWVIDDTYNGNVEGIRAGTNLLAELHATRKLYVTPGLVDQGVETRTVHETIGQLIANAAPDIVVLMRNSTTKYIQQGLKEAKFSGELRIEKNPLEFYTNLKEYVANGDLVMLQNDWPDNYA